MNSQSNEEKIVELVQSCGIVGILQHLAIISEYFAVGTAENPGDPVFFEIAALLSDCQEKVNQTIIRSHFLKEKNK
jgi:hypothetical protein